MRLSDGLALVLGAAGVVAVVAAALVPRSWRLGLGLALDLWLAGGLLRLTGDPSWQRIAAAAAIVTVRRLIGSGLRTVRPGVRAAG